MKTPTAFFRNCPQCSKILYYSNKGTRDLLIRRNSTCSSCSRKNTYKENPSYLEEVRKRMHKFHKSGTENQFYGKKHTKESIEKMKIYQNSDIKKQKFKDPKVIENMSRATSGKNNPRYGSKNNYELWIEKYGKDVADQKLTELKEKQSKNNSGVNNPMYGKPSPSGSGAGIQGWYKDWFFRSLHELWYMINVIGKNNWSWLSAETKDMAIPYTNWEGKQKNYFPDFLINGTILIEIKPKNLHKSQAVQDKANAAKQYCLLKGWEYRLESSGKFTQEEIDKLYTSGDIKFTEKSLEKYLNYNKT